MSQQPVHAASAGATSFDPTEPSQLQSADDAGNSSSATDPDVRKPSAGIKRAVFAAALLSLAAAGWMGWQRLHGTPAVSPLEPTAAVDKVPVPLPSEMAETPKLKESLPQSPASAPPLGKSVDPATGDAIEELVGVPPRANNSTTSPAAETAVDTPATLRTALNALTGRAETLEAVDRENTALVQDHATKLAELRKEIELLKGHAQVVAKGAAPRSASAKPASAGPDIDMSEATAEPAQAQRPASPTRRTAAARPARPSPTSSADASVLAVDLWGGKPSVAVGRPGAAGTELRFLNEGESQGRVTLKRADIASQNATFVTPEGERTYAPRER
jgi:hypothetical protein